MSEMELTINADLLEFANDQNAALEKRLARKMWVSAVLLVLIVVFGVALTFDANDQRVTPPILVDGDGTTRVLPPIMNLSNTLKFSATLADIYAMRLMNFHFLKLEEQMRSRRLLFVDDATYERVYRNPLQEAGAFDRIQENNYIITSASVRNADLVSSFVKDGERYIKYRVRLIQTAEGPSGVPETNRVILSITFKHVTRDKAIEGLLISDLGTIRQ